jgi:hypothetical protein
MPNYYSLQIPPPSNWQDFETLCCDLWRNIWNDLNAVKNGRQGQSQYGVDIYGRPNQGSRWAGIQCKGRTDFGAKHLLETELLAEATKARSFYPPLSEFIIATTGPKDSKVEEVARRITNENLSTGLFTVHVWGWRDIVERLSEFPDVIAKHYPHLSQNKKPDVESLLGQTVGIYQSMGFHLVTLDPSNALAIMQAETGERYLMKTVEGEISRDHVQAATAVSDANAVLISQLRIAPSARSFALSQNVIVRTISELYRDALSADGLERAYQTAFAKIEKSYVDLSAERRTYDLAGFLKYTEIYDPIDSMLADWLDETGRNQITLLGDYGTGKSWFCLKFTAELAAASHSKGQSRFPLFVSLRSYRKNENIYAYILRALKEQWGVTLPHGAQAIERANVDGRVVFLFDGFDEMTHEVDGTGMTENFERVASVVRERSKILLTCRRQYFRNNRELNALLKTNSHDSLIDLEARPNFEILHLREFSVPQIQEVLEKREGANWLKTYSRILAVYDLPELARRPVLLDMMLSTLPSIPANQPVNSAVLYELYTNKWLAREEERGGVVITTKLKEKFTQELSWQMFKSQKLELDYSALPKWVRSYFASSSIQVSASLVKEIQQQSFLQRDENDRFRFAHRSFLEFFVAKRFVLNIEEQNYSDFDQIPLSTEVISFIRDLVSVNNFDLTSLFKFVLNSKNRSFDQVGYGPGNALSILVSCGYDLRGKNFSATVLRNVDFQNADLSQTDFSFCDLRGTRLQRANMTNTSFYAADMQSTVIGESNVIRSVQNSSDGNTLVCAGSGEFVFKLNAKTGALLARLPQRASVRVVAYVGEKQFATAGIDGRIRIWDDLEGVLKGTLIGDEFAIFTMAISENKQWLASGAQSGTILLWSLEDQEIVAKHVRAHLPYVRCLRFVRDAVFVSGGADNRLKVWSLSGANPRTLETQGLPYALMCSHNEDFLYCGTNKPSIEVWDTNTWQRIGELQQHSDTITALIRNPTNDELMSVGREGRVCVWDTNSNQLKTSYEFGATIMSGCYVGRSDACAFGFNDGYLRAYEPDSMNLLWEFQISESDFACEGMDIRNVKGFAPEWIRYMRELGAVTS